MTNTQDDCRRAFEKWYNDFPVGGRAAKEGLAWTVWQAAWSTRPSAAGDVVTLVPIKCVDGKYATDENGFLYKLNQFGTSKACRVILSRYGKKNNAYFDIVHMGKKIRFYQDWLKDMQENAIGKVMGDWK